MVFVLFKDCFSGLNDTTEDDDEKIERQVVDVRGDTKNIVSLENLHSSLSLETLPSTSSVHQIPGKSKPGNEIVLFESTYKLFLIVLVIMCAIVSHTNIFDLDVLSAAQRLIMLIYRSFEPFAIRILMIEILVAPLFFQRKRGQVEKEKTLYQPSSDLGVDTSTDTDTETISSSSSFSTKSSSKQSRASLISENDVGFEEALRNLPAISEWKYRTIFIQPAGETKCPGVQTNQSLSLGVPIDFESELFKGKILFRFREGNTDDERRHLAYFESSKYKVQRQIVIQGRFKRRLKMSEMYMGDISDKKWVLSPSPRIGRMVSSIFTRLAPGLIIDIAAEKPKVLSLIGGGSHEISIDEPGYEPDMTAPNIPENTFLSNSIETSEARKKVLGNPKEALHFEFNPDMVYTFHSFDEVLDLANFQFKLPFLKIDIANTLGDQPISVRAVTSPNDGAYETLFFFRIWHKRTVRRLQNKLIK